jgi:cytoskeletal protein RodZ
VGFGRELQQQREERGVALEAIASGTKVSILHLRALEGERRGDLPGGVFNKGIVRSYCQFVGLEESEWLQRFALSEMGETAEPDLEAFAESVRRNRLTTSRRQGRGWLGVALMMLALVTLAWAVWRYAVRPHVLQSPRVPDVTAERSGHPAPQPANHP